MARESLITTLALFSVAHHADGQPHFFSHFAEIFSRGLWRKSHQSSANSCHASLRFSPPAKVFDRSGELSYCKEHQSLTCCSRLDTNRILRANADVFRHPPSAKCKELTMKAECAKCDFHVGTGAKTAEGRPLLCESFCSKWLDACWNQFFESPLGRGLLLCQPDSLVCSKLSSITNDPSEFCQRRGFAVADDEVGSSAHCYDGVSAAETLPAGPRPPRRAAAAAAVYLRLVKSHFDVVNRVMGRYSHLLPGIVFGGLALFSLVGRVASSFGLTWGSDEDAPLFRLSAAEMAANAAEQRMGRARLELDELLQTDKEYQELVAQDFNTSDSRSRLPQNDEKLSCLVGVAPSSPPACLDPGDQWAQRVESSADAKTPNGADGGAACAESTKLDSAGR